MITITKKQFKELCKSQSNFKVVAWPKHRKEMYLSELIEMAMDADVGHAALQWAMWKYDHRGWSNAMDRDGYKALVNNYLNKQAESDMEVKELVELFEEYEYEDVTVNLQLVLFRDGSGRIENWDGEMLFDFEDTDELEHRLQYEPLEKEIDKIRQKPPDLFSVVDGELHPKLQEFLKSLMEEK